MPQRTSKILIVRLTANRNALSFLIRVTSRKYRNCNKNNRNLKFSDIFWINSRHFFLQTVFIFHQKPTEPPVFPLFNSVSILIHEVYRKYGNEIEKVGKIGKFRKSCLFRCQFEIFFIEKTGSIFFGKAYWITNCCLVQRFQHSNPRRLSKI